MKKLRTSLSALLVCVIAMNAKAQLTGTRWKGIANVPTPLDCLFYFKTDTLLLQYAGSQPVTLTGADGDMISATGKDSIVIETMTYKISGDTLTLQKVKGGSPCTDEIGAYKITIKDNKLLVALIDDACEARVQAWPADPLTRVIKIY